MNNNRGNNRRRGRGNNNGNRQQGGGQQLNRIDSRARGNAPQLLEKYRKLAHDAHLNGDRVTEEYYLQFADHYFRVIADQRQRQEEQRARRDERWQDGGSESEREDSEYGSDYAADDYTAYDQPHRQQREDRPQRQQEERAERPERAERVEREPTEARGNEAAEDAAGEGERSPYEPVENPFVREGRSSRGLRPRREGGRETGRDAPRESTPREASRESGRDAPREANREERRPRRERAKPADSEAAPAFDASVLPPAISVSREEPAEAPAPVVAEEVEAEAKPRRRTTRKPKPPAGETLETVN